MSAVVVNWSNWSWLALATLLAAPAQAEVLQERSQRFHPQWSAAGMVASQERWASLVGAEILASGGNTALFIAHVKAVLISYGFVGIGTAIILWIVGATVGLRVTPEQEERGLDFVAHGEEAYDPMTN